MTAPEWAVEALTSRLHLPELYEQARQRMLKDATGTTFEEHMLRVTIEAAALELSRRCVPIEEYQRVVELANKLDGYTLHKTQCALYQSSYAMNFPECSCGLTDAREDLLTRAAFKETGDAE
jgi:hypothetical protein